MIWHVVGAFGVGLLTLVASVVVILAGPPLAGEWSGRTQIARITQGQLERQYRVYRPTGLSARPGLVIDLHSARTNGFLEELATRFEAQADRLGWIVAYPDGFADGWEPYGCCHHQGVDDRSEEHTSELQSRPHLVCRLLLEKKKENAKHRFGRRQAVRITHSPSN